MFVPLKKVFFFVLLRWKHIVVCNLILLPSFRLAEYKEFTLPLPEYYSDNSKIIYSILLFIVAYVEEAFDFIML